MPWMNMYAEPTKPVAKKETTANKNKNKINKKTKVQHVVRRPVLPPKSIEHQKTPINLPHVDLSHHAKDSGETNLLTSLERNLINFIRSTISTLNYTRYMFGGNKFDTTRGVYVVDCSAYIDHILKNMSPHAYKSLKNFSGSERPTTNHYYHYFQNLTDESSHWNTVEKVESLRPGDVIVFRYQKVKSKEIAGHVMIVMEQPKRKGNVFLIRIADSAPSAHSKDTRLPATSGIGIGTMLLKIDPNTHLPYAYAWKIGSQFKKNVNIAMARPIEKK